MKKEIKIEFLKYRRSFITGAYKQRKFMEEKRERERKKKRKEVRNVAERREKIVQRVGRRRKDPSDLGRT